MAQVSAILFILSAGPDTVEGVKQLDALGQQLARVFNENPSGVVIARQLTFSWDPEVTKDADKVAEDVSKVIHDPRTPLTPSDTPEQVTEVRSQMESAARLGLLRPFGKSPRGKPS